MEELKETGDAFPDEGTVEGVQGVDAARSLPAAYPVFVSSRLANVSLQGLASLLLINRHESSVRGPAQSSKDEYAAHNNNNNNKAGGTTQQ